MDQIEYIKRLYAQHDLVETNLIEYLRQDPDAEHADLWELHDELERKIIYAEAKLPREVADKLREGSL